MTDKLKLEKGDVVVWKDEDSLDGDPIGPVWIFRGKERLNYQDSDNISPISKKPYPEWFSRREAYQLAKQNGLEFQEA